MLIDDRKTVLKTAKKYNNSRNYLLNVYPLKLGEKEMNRKKLLKMAYPDENNASLLNQNEESLAKLLKKDNGSLTAIDYSRFSKLFAYESLLLFKDIDEINIFENQILNECFDKFNCFIHDSLRCNAGDIEVFSLKKSMMRDHDHFYYEPVKAALECIRFFCSDLRILENQIITEGLNYANLKKYLNVAQNFLNEGVMPQHKVFGKFSFNNMRNDPKNDVFEKSLIGLDEYTKQTTLSLLMARNGESARFVLGDKGFFKKDQNPSEFEIRKAKVIEDSGMHLVILGRFRKYNSLSLYSDKLSKGAEIVAVNNWIDFFTELKQLLFLYATASNKSQLIQMNCSNLLDTIIELEFGEVSATKNEKMKKLQLQIDNIGSLILPILIEDYTRLINSSVVYSFLTD